METMRLLDLGRRPYAAVWDLQRTLHAAVAEDRAPSTWIVVEHEPVITLGRNAKETNLRLPRPLLAQRGLEVYAVERGGDVTYHGPGQVVLYPIVKLPRFREIVPLVSALENAVLAALATFGITGATHRNEHRGVYVGREAICAIGLAVKRMTSMHGIALNACTGLDYDRLITPCGTPEFGITSLTAQLGRTVSWAEGRDALLAAVERSFGFTFVPTTEGRDATEPPVPASLR
ncbi:MAG: lipoyl(octanoyl) transferase LipB [Candidatus Velthaea sp.]|jgi:lipoyl(octanoyl) transferase